MEKLAKLKIKEAASVSSSSAEANVESPTASLPPVKLAVKHDWYQTESHICVAVLAKNLNPTDVQVQFSTQEV